MQNLDHIIFQWLNSWAGVSQFFDWAIIVLATYLWPIVMLGVSCFVALTVFNRFRKYQGRNIELFIFTFISAFTARFVVAELIRFFYDRPRPFEMLNGVHQLIDHAAGKSFPSGHASLAFAVAAAVSFYYPKTSILFFLAALSIGMGRIAAGVHWPSDILGGALVGILTVYTVRYFFQKFLSSSPRLSDLAKTKNKD